MDPGEHKPTGWLCAEELIRSNEFSAVHLDIAFDFFLVKAGDDIMRLPTVLKGIISGSDKWKKLFTGITDMKLYENFRKSLFSG